MIALLRFFTTIIPLFFNRLKVNECTLRKRLKNGQGATTLGRYQPIFTTKQENEIAQHCRDLDARFYGLSRRSLQKLVYEYAERNKIPNPFNEQTRMAGRDWTNSFLKRHRLSLRSPMKTSMARIMSFNRTQVERFFDNLCDLKEKYNFQPDQIYNVDESGFSTVPNKIEKVISERGKKRIGKAVSAERGQLITVVGCLNAEGSLVPPAFIFPRIRHKPELMEGAPRNSLQMCNESGYMNVDLFLQWLEHFKKYAKPREDNQILLILDNHVSHISYNAVMFCRENHIHLLSLPPHASHRLQPLDLGVFGNLKLFYAQECETWLTNNPGLTITQRTFAKIFGKAYSKIMHPKYGIKAFKKGGIEPYNRYIFSDEDFLPSAVTDQHPQASPDPSNNHAPNNGHAPTNDPPSDPVQTVRVEENVILEDFEPNVLNIEEPIISSPESEIVVPILDADGSVIGSVNATIDDSFKESVSPKEILPFPAIKQPRQRSNRAGASTILTCTPEKTKLELKKAAAEEQIRVRNEKLKARNEKLKAKNDKSKAKREPAKQTGQVSKTRAKKRSQSKGNENTPPSKVSRALFSTSATAQIENSYECPACNEVYEDPPVI